MVVYGKMVSIVDTYPQRYIRTWHSWFTVFFYMFRISTWLSPDPLSFVNKRWGMWLQVTEKLCYLNERVYQIKWRGFYMVIPCRPIHVLCVLKTATCYTPCTGELDWSVRFFLACNISLQMRTCALKGNQDEKSGSSIDLVAFVWCLVMNVKSNPVIKQSNIVMQ